MFARYNTFIQTHFVPKPLNPLLLMIRRNTARFIYLYFTSSDKVDIRRRADKSLRSNGAARYDNASGFAYCAVLDLSRSADKSGSSTVTTVELFNLHSRQLTPPVRNCLAR